MKNFKKSLRGTGRLPHMGCCSMMYLFCVYGRHLALTNTLWHFQRHTSACQVSSSARGSRSASHLTCAATARMTVAMERTRQTAVRPSFHLYFSILIPLWTSLVVLKAAFGLACFCEKGLAIESDTSFLCHDVISWRSQVFPAALCVLHMIAKGLTVGFRAEKSGGRS